MESKETERPSGKIQKVFIVMNPVSGVQDNEDARSTIDAFCESNGLSCEIHETSPNEDLTGTIRKKLKEGVDCVVAAGGDGTVAAAVKGIVRSDVPLAILPLGTGNNLARDLRIPLALEDALGLIVAEDHHRQVIDLIQVGDDYYVMNVSIGVSADTMFETPRAEKQKFGMLAYLRRGIESINKADLNRFLVEVDGRRIRFSASEVMITNVRFMGLQPQLEGVVVEDDDGALNMFIVRASRLIDYLGVLRRFIIPARQKDETQLKHIAIRDRALIKTDRPARVQADGEPIGETPVEIRVVPNALRIIVPGGS